MPEPHATLNRLSEADAASTLRRCCGSEPWVHDMLELRPFASTDALYAAASRLWRDLSADEHQRAFAHHPRIGEDPEALARRFGSTAALSGREQAGVHGATPQTLAALGEENRAYEARFGFVFLVCATGKSGDEMLALLRERLTHDRDTELRIAAEEQEKITRLRLAGLAP